MLAAQIDPRWRQLQKVRVSLAERGRVVVNERLTTSVPHIWAVGDVTGGRNLTPVALMEGMAFASFCFGKKGSPPPPLDYTGIPSAVRPRALLLSRMAVNRTRL